MMAKKQTNGSLLKEIRDTCHDIQLEQVAQKKDISYIRGSITELKTGHSNQQKDIESLKRFKSTWTYVGGFLVSGSVGTFFYSIRQNIATWFRENF